MTLHRQAVEDAASYAAEWVTYRQRTADVPGICIAVAHDGDLVLEHAVGFADLEQGTPLRTDHGFRIASHSKTFTATAVLRLAEEERLALDDRLARWLPDLERAPLGRVRLRELLSHAAGVSRDGEDAPWWQLRGPFLDVAGLLHAAAADVTAVLDRNDRFKYSNIGYSLLGQVIEAVTGEDYGAHVRREIVDRLGLTATGPEPTEGDLETLATGYTSRKFGFERRPIPHLDTRAMAAATGFHSTAADLCRYGAAHFFGDDRLLSDESKREMQHEHWKVHGGRGGHYGLGFHVAKIGERRLISHGGGFPGFITYTSIDPVDRLVVTALTNAIDGPAEIVVNAIVRLVDRAAGGGDVRSDLDRYTGRFFGLWGTTDVVRLGGELVSIDPDQLDPVADASRLEPVEGDDDLRIADTVGYGSFGERVRYDWDDEGGVAGVQFAAARLLPHEAYLTELSTRTASVSGRPTLRSTSSSGNASDVASPPST